MKVSSKYKPEIICSRGKCRRAINETCVQMVEGKPSLVATDGRRLVVIPVQADESEFGPVPKEAITLARLKRADKKQGVVEIKLNGKVELENGWTLPRPTQEELKYPDVQKVIPEASHKDTKVSFNARFLYDIACAMGVDVVTISFREMCAIKVTAQNEGAFGVLMPVRVS